VVYSDAPELIGRTFELDANELESLRTGEMVATTSDPTQPQNRLESGLGSLLEVSVPVHTLGGDALLFQAYLRADAVAASGRELWSAFVPVLAVALLALALLQIPFAYRLARRVRDSRRDRERLLRRAIESSDMERRRIAHDLHDGLVQEMAGLSMSLAAAADSLPPGDPAAPALRDAGARTRAGVRSLRSALMGIYPPSLRRAGLPAALSDLAAPLEEDGVQTRIDVPADLGLPDEVKSLLFRASQEAIRNVSTHAGARHLYVQVTSERDRAVLLVTDDGVGFTPDAHDRARADGHVGLRLLEDLARDADGTLEVASTPGEGTRVRLEVPLR
jgi:signal transduction histidine kinase